MQECSLKYQTLRQERITPPNPNLVEHSIINNWIIEIPHIFCLKESNTHIFEHRLSLK